MAIGQPSALLQYLRKSVFDPRGAQGTDGELLTEFVERRDEAAFEALVRRHGPMVLGVCNRLLANEHDSEDAFQATFLVLVRKAKSIVPREMVGNWLYGVAHNTALKARAVSVKRQSRERRMCKTQQAESERQCQNLWDDLKPLLDQELSRLPDKYRVPIVLCDLEGKAHHEAARQLGWPEGTLSGRLSRARTLLAKRLGRRGLALSVGLMVEAVSQNANSAWLPPTLASSTVWAAILYAAGQMGITATVSPKVASLVKGALKTMLMRKLIMAAAVLATAVSGVGGTGLLIYQTQAAQRPGSDKSTRIANSQSRADQNGSVSHQGTFEESRVRQLQNERLAVLKQIAADKQAQVNASQGHVTAEELMQANSAALKAELELCESENATILVLEKLVANAREFEKSEETLFKIGRCASYEFYAAKANRLEAEIELERAKAKVAPKPK